MVTARTEESFSVTRRREDCREWVCARCNTTAYTQGEGVTPMRWRIHRDPHLCVECSGNSHLYNYTWQPDLLGGKGRDVVTTNVARELLWIVSPELEYSNTWRESEPVMTPKMFYRKTLWAPCHDSSCGFEMKGPALIADSNGVVLNGLPPEVIKVINRSDPSDAGGHLNISAWRGQRPDSSLLPILAGAHVLLPLFAFCWPDRATNAQCRIPHVNWSLSKKKQAACLKVGTCVEIRIIPAYSSSAMLFSTIKLVVQFLARFKALVDTSDMNNLSHWHDSDLVGFMMDYAVRYGDKTQASIQAIADRGRSNRANQFDYFLGYTSDLRRRMEIRANRCLEAQQ